MFLLSINFISLIAGLIASGFTFFDLENKFYIPKEVSKRISLSLFFWGFILLNGVISIGLYYGLGVQPFPKFVPSWFTQLPEWCRALIVGTGYLGFVRLKFTTFKVQDQEIPFGIEFFYNQVKDWVYKKINEIAKEARYIEVDNMVKNSSLNDLISKAKILTNADALLSRSDKESIQVWIEKINNDLNSSDEDKKASLAVATQNKNHFDPK